MLLERRILELLSHWLLVVALMKDRDCLDHPVALAVNQLIPPPTSDLLTFVNHELIFNNFGCFPALLFEFLRLCARFCCSLWLSNILFIDTSVCQGGRTVDFFRKSGRLARSCFFDKNPKLSPVDHSSSPSHHITLLLFHYDYVSHVASRCVCPSVVQTCVFPSIVLCITGFSA